VTREEFQAELLRRGYSPHTIRAYLRAFEYVSQPQAEAIEKVPAQAVWQYVSVLKICGIPVEPATRMRARERAAQAKFQARRPSTPLHYNALIRIPMRSRPLARFIAATGMRISSALSLCWEDIQDGRVFVRRAKGRRPYVIPLPGKVDLPPRGAPNERVFRIHERMFRRDLAKAGLTPHGLRRAFATQLLQRNVPISTVARLLNHSSVAVTQGYYQPSDADLLAAMEVLPWT